MSVELEMDEAVYHAHPALSATGAKEILRSPAHYRHMMTGPRVERKTFDVGHAVHALVLGVGMPVAVIPEELLSSNGAASTTAAKTFIAEARAKGQVPLKAAEAAPVFAMAESVLAHPIARRAFEQPGAPEVSLFADDPTTGVGLRARVDYLPHARPAARTVMVDLKTTVDADPHAFEANARKLGYYLQESFYANVLHLARGDADAAFLFVAVEKTDPYLVSVNELDEDHRRIGRAHVRRAIDIYAECLESGRWPGYDDTRIHSHAPPLWWVTQNEENVA